MSCKSGTLGRTASIVKTIAASTNKYSFNDGADTWKGRNILGAFINSESGAESSEGVTSVTAAELAKGYLHLQSADGSTELAVYPLSMLGSSNCECNPVMFSFPSDCNPSMVKSYINFPGTVPTAGRQVEIFFIFE